MNLISTPQAAAAWISAQAEGLEVHQKTPAGRLYVGPLSNAHQADFVLDAAKGCSAARLTDPELEVPALNFLAKMSGDYHKAVETYLVAEAAHRRFAASQSFDDPGHGEHQQRVMTARETMTAANSALSLAERALLRIRGELVS